jgi:hypothetical protein
MPDNPTMLPLSVEKLDIHLEQRIQERLNLGHLYQIEDSEDGPEACCTGRAAASIWRVVQDAIREAGWKIVK